MKLNKAFKVILTLAIATMLVLGCCIGLAACGDKDVTGTYTNTVSGKDNLTGMLHGGGFAETTICDTAKITVTLELKDDNTYVLTKFYDAGDKAKMPNPADGSEMDVRIKIKFVYYGEYTVKGDVVTLKVCTKMDYDEDWGVFAQMGFGPITQKGTTEDFNFTANAGLTTSYMASFPGMGMSASSEGNVDQEITLKGSSFSYVEVNLDD